MDTWELVCNDDRVGWMQLNKILTFTEDYDGINIDDEKNSILPEELQTLFMSDINGHNFASPDADRVMNQLYTDCFLIILRFTVMKLKS